MKAIVIGLIVVLALVAVAVVANNNYQNEQIQVQYKQKVYCTGAHHVGNVVFEEKTLAKTVARKDRRTVHDLEDRGLCPACQAREEREARVRRCIGIWKADFATFVLEKDGSGTYSSTFLGARSIRWTVSGNELELTISSSSEYPRGRLSDDGRSVTLSYQGTSMLFIKQ